MNEFDDDIESMNSERRDDLEQRLELKGVYKAIFDSYDDFWEKLIVKIQDPLNSDKYYKAVLVRSINAKWGDRSNRIRDDVISKRDSAEPFDVMVINEPPYGASRYIVVASTGGVACPKSKYEITAEEAFAVLKGEKTFYARYVDDGDFGDPALAAYRYNGGAGIRVFGFLAPVEHNSWNISPVHKRRGAERIITRELIRGSKNKEALQEGSYLLARDITTDSFSKNTFFEPVVNFMEFNNAFSSGGDRLVTKVHGYDRGDIIHNLPIIYVKESIATFEMLGVGYVKRPRDDPKRFYYKQVLVKGAESDKGKYVSKAEIITNGTGVILAKKII